MVRVGGASRERRFKDVLAAAFACPSFDGRRVFAETAGSRCQQEGRLGREISPPIRVTYKAGLKPAGRVIWVATRNNTAELVSACCPQFMQCLLWSLVLATVVPQIKLE